MNLATAWEILGGLPCSGICGYIADTLTLEMNPQYTTIIEKKAENMYRTINQKMASFPASNQAVMQKVSFTPDTDLTPQETEQLSQYASDDSYVQRQKEDIQELASIFRGKMNGTEDQEKEAYISDFRKRFQPQPGVRAEYCLHIGESTKPVVIRVDGKKMECFYGEAGEADVVITMEASVMQDIIAGRMTFQRAFMSGMMKEKGDFKLLRMLDQLFVFSA